MNLTGKRRLEMYKKSVSVFWTPEELDLSKDVDDFNKLNNNEKFFIKQILAFFTGFP
jgi:ribonucleotide reductase beta subunit family protein with ferritin-like domain